VVSEWAASAREKGEMEWVSTGDGWVMSVCVLLGGVVGGWLTLKTGLISAELASPAIRLTPLIMVKNSKRPVRPSRWVDWKASANAAAILTSRSCGVSGGNDSAALSDFTASIRCCNACSAILELDTASRCEAESARIAWTR
jgi:hypothetical protein